MESLGRKCKIERNKVKSKLCGCPLASADLPYMVGLAAGSEHFWTSSSTASNISACEHEDEQLHRLIDQW